MELVVQTTVVAGVPLNVTLFPVAVEPKPVPAIVTVVPVEPEAGERLEMFGTTVNAKLLLTTPFTVTTTLPVDAVAGRGTVMEPLAHVLGVAVAPLKVTVFPVAMEPNPEPLIVTVVPVIAEVGDKPVILGKTVNLTPLLCPPLTVTTAFPVVAVAGTVVVMAVPVQVVVVARTPLNVNTPVVAVPKPVPFTVTDVPTTPEVTVRLLMTGKAVPLPVRVTV
jgi:hypothetical protein